MQRRMMVSALFVAGLLAVAALAQPPGTEGGNDPSQPAKDKKQPLGEKVKPADPGDVAVTAALANDPDVKVARAKVQLAEAELAKAKQLVVLKVMTLNATIEENKRAVRFAEGNLARMSELVKTGVAQSHQLLVERDKLESAKAALARAETELKLLAGTSRDKERVNLWIGDFHDADSANLAAWLSQCDPPGDPSVTRALTLFDGRWLALRQAMGEKSAMKGPVPDRIRAALDKPVKLGAKGEKVTFEKGMEVFKRAAGLDAPVRGLGDLVEGPLEILTQGEELPVVAWLQLYQDYAPVKGSAFYVREYGLLFTTKTMAPPDAPTLTEFWKQKPPAMKESELKDPEAMLQFLKHKRTEMSTTYKPNHPEMIALNKQIEQLELELKYRGEQKKK